MRKKGKGKQIQDTSVYDDRLIGASTLGGMAIILKDLIKEYGPDAYIELDAGHNNICVEITPSEVRDQQILEGVKEKLTDEELRLLTRYIKNQK